MNAFWQYLSGTVSTHWESGFFQWYFYLGILLVLLLEKRKAVRIVMGWLPVCFLLVVYNPLCGHIMDWMFEHKPGAYLSRLFTFIPLFYVMAHGAVLLLSRLKDGAKFLCVCLVAASIALSGSSVYHQYWMHPAENREKVPAAVLETLQSLEALEEENLCVAAPEEISVYLRQLSPDLYTPYTRYPNKLGRALAEQEPDPVQIMTWAGQQAVDVVVAWNLGDIRTLFEEAGWEPFAVTDSCLLYRVSGVPRILRSFDENRRILSKTTLDAEGNPVIGSQGFVTIRYGYDEKGNIIRYSYYDASGEPMIREGQKYASYEYIDDGQPKLLIRYYDTEGNVVKERRTERD